MCLALLSAHPIPAALFFFLATALLVGDVSLTQAKALRGLPHLLTELLRTEPAHWAPADLPGLTRPNRLVAFAAGRFNGEAMTSEPPLFSRDRSPDGLDHAPQGARRAETTISQKLVDKRVGFRWEATTAPPIRDPRRFVAEQFPGRCRATQGINDLGSRFQHANDF